MREQGAPKVLMVTGLGVAVALALLARAASKDTSPVIIISFEERLIGNAPSLNFKTRELDPSMIQPAIYIKPVTAPIDEATKQVALEDQKLGVLLFAVSKNKKRAGLSFARAIADPPILALNGAGP